MYMAIMIKIQNRNFWTDFCRARGVAGSPDFTAVGEPFNLSKTVYPSNVGFDPKFLVTRQIRVIISDPQLVSFPLLRQCIPSCIFIGYMPLSIFEHGGTGWSLATQL